MLYLIDPFCKHVISWRIFGRKCEVGPNILSITKMNQGSTFNLQSNFFPQICIGVT